MINFIKDFLKKNRVAKIKKAIGRKQAQAMQMQRDGNLRQYAEIIKEIEQLEEQAMSANQDA
jgi:hypothetical protein